MTYSGEQNSRPKSSEAFDSNAIKSTLYGGLNTSSSALSIPTEDSPALDNIFINDRGNIQVREGTEMMHSLSIVNQRGATIVSYRTRTGQTLLFIKDGVDLLTYVERGHQYVPLHRKDGVWPESARDVKPDYVITNEPITRIIFTCGVAAPVQVTLAEQGKLADVVSNVVHLPYLKPLELASDAFTHSISLFADGEPVVVNSFNSATDEVNVELNDGTYLFETLYITWQWWASAIKLKGNQVYNVNFRYHANASDASVSIPVELLSDIEPNVEGSYPIRAYKSTAADPYTFVPYTPSGVDEYGFSYGISYDSGTNDSMAPGFSHITFGDADISTSPAEDIETVHFIRGYKLFDFESLLASFNLYVEVAGTEWTAFNGVDRAPNQYTLRDQNFDYTAVDGQYITFDGGVEFKIPPLEDIHIVYATLNSGVSTNANTNVSIGKLLLKDGQPKPIYGLHEHCDIVAGTYPRAITLYNNRLALAGFPNNPMKVTLSNILDYITPGNYFSSFQLLLDAAYDSGPIDLNLGTDDTEGQPIVAMEEFADNLFVFTPVSAVRVRGSGTGNIKAVEATIISMGALGVFNAQCLVKAENRLILFGPQGVHAVIPVAEIGGFRVEEISTKVRGAFVNTGGGSDNRLVAWVAFSSANNRLAVGAGDGVNRVTASVIYTYSFTYKAWSQHTTLSGTHPVIKGFYVYYSDSLERLAMVSSQYHVNDTIADTTCFIQREGYFLPLDYVEEKLYSEINGGFQLSPRALEVKHTTTRLIRKYRTNIEATGQFTGFVMNPDPNVEDVVVYLDGVRVPFRGNGFYKTNSTTIYLQYPVNDGQELVIRYGYEAGVERTPVEVYADNVPLVPNEEYTIEIDNEDRYVVTLLQEYNPNTIIKTGVHVRAYWTTPLFVRQTLFHTKRLKRVAVFLRNPNEVWNELDVNADSFQSIDALLNRYKISAKLFVSVFADGIFSEFYGDSLIRWDDAMFDIDSSIGQSEDYVSLSVPLLGRLKQFQLRFWSVGPFMWEMVGYQVEATVSNKDARRNTRSM